VKQNSKKHSFRRVPTQQRAQVTVEAMLDAAIKLLKRGGASAITTNRIAELAGVSIGSVYQYFPNKRAIYIALHQRHISQADSRMQRCLTESADSTLAEFIASLIDGMIELHREDPDLPGLLETQVPHHVEGAPDFSVRFYKRFRDVLVLRSGELGRTNNLDMQAFFLGNMVESFGHAIVLRRPAGLSLSRAKAETLRAILAYLES